MEQLPAQDPQNSQQQAQQAHGSIWNPNSWHWEQKNYTEKAKELLKNKIMKLNFVKEKELSIETSEVIWIKGDAEINVRKGKQVLIYEFSVRCEWTAISKDDLADGTYEIEDINPFDEDYQLVECKPEEITNFSQRCVDNLKKKIIPMFVESMKTFQEELQYMEANPQKIEQDRINREKAKELTEEARQKNGELKEQIQKEKQLKAQNLQKE